MAISDGDKDQRHQEKSSSIGGCLTIGHPGQVPQSGTRAGIQEELAYVEIPLDSGSRPP